VTEADPDDIGPDGTVRLRAYLTMANSLWFSAGCEGEAGCGHSAPIGVQATVRQLVPHVADFVVLSRPTYWRFQAQ
jgi:hypothetical protein